MKYYKNKTNEELCALYQNGDDKALNDLCVQNKPLCYMLAQQWLGRYGNRLDLDDLAQIALISVMNAAKKFDIHQTEWKFVSYCGTVIERDIQRAIAYYGFSVRLPVNVLSKLFVVAALYDRLEAENVDVEDRIKMICQEVNLTPDKVWEFLKCNKTLLMCKSLSTTKELKESCTDYDSIWIDKIMYEDDEQYSVEAEIEYQSLTEELNQLMETLTKREQFVIKSRYYDELTLEQTGKIFGVTRERIRQIESKALRKLRRLAFHRQLYVYR